METKKGILGFAKDMFTTEIPDKKVTRNTPFPSALPTQNGFAPPSTAPDPQAVQKLEARLQASTPAEYTTFMESFQALSEDIPDPKTRFKVTLKTTKIPIDHLIEMVDQMVEVMNTANQEFVKSLSERLGAHEALEQSIVAKMQQLQHMTEELASLEARSHDEQIHLETVKSGFAAAHSVVVSELQVQKQRFITMKG